jgi:hypothetical protein
MCPTHYHGTPFSGVATEPTKVYLKEVNANINNNISFLFTGQGVISSSVSAE